MSSPEEDKQQKTKRLIEIFKEYIDQANILLKSKNILFFHEIQNLLLDLKYSLGEQNVEEQQKIEFFLQHNMEKIIWENNLFISSWEKLNFFDLPTKDNKLSNELMSVKAELENYKENMEILNQKNASLDFHLNIVMNKSDSDVNSGLKKTIQKVIYLEKKNKYFESKEQNFIKQIYLLKGENLKLFVSILKVNNSIPFIFCRRKIDFIKNN